jgi:hypothetical protein
VAAPAHWADRALDRVAGPPRRADHALDRAAGLPCGSCWIAWPAYRAWLIMPWIAQQRPGALD